MGYNGEFGVSIRNRGPFLFVKYRMKDLALIVLENFLNLIIPLLMNSSAQLLRSYYTVSYVIHVIDICNNKKPK